MPRSWYWPFLWVTLVPLAAVPASVALGQNLPLLTPEQVGVAYGAGWAARDDAFSTLAPSLAALLAFAWLLAGNARTVWAALWAGAVAVAHLVVPGLIIAGTGLTGADGMHYVDWNPTRAIIFVAQVELWLGGVLAWLAFSLTTRVVDRVTQQRMEPVRQG